MSQAKLKSMNLSNEQAVIKDVANTSVSVSDRPEAEKRRQIQAPPSHRRSMDKPSTSSRSLDEECNQLRAEEPIKEAEHLKADIIRPLGMGKSV